MNDTETKEDPRKTQFAGFAKLLVEEIINEVPATIYPLEIDISDKLEKLLARRAYDLVQHVLCDHREIQWQPLESICMAEIADLTELPKDSQ